MPRYFFHVHENQNLPDREGNVIDGAEGTCAQAVTFAGVLLKDLDGRF